jgi:fatty acid amide hydrolase 2
VNVLTASAIELAASIRSGALTSRAVVDAHIAQLEAAQRRTNAVAVPLYEEAREAADRADAAGEPTGPLHGVPVTIKESIGLEGRAFTCGLLSRREEVAGRTAPAAQRLLDAGAIPLAQTNVPELVMWMESYNPVYGRTRNAYSARRSAGGSSGGEGAAVGTGGVPFGLGSDVGGSIRIPAFFNGVFGHKPSPGLVPNDGMYPPSSSETDRLLSVGPLARRAEDLAPVLGILAGRPIEDPARVSLDGLAVTVVETPGMLPVRRDIRDGLRRAAEALEQAGARVRQERHPGFRRGFDMWGAALSTAEEVTFRELLGGGEPSRRRRLVGDTVRRRSNHTLPAVILAVIEDYTKLYPPRTRKLIDAARRLGDEVKELIGDGVLLYPPFPRVAPLHGMQLLNPLAGGYCAIFNVLGLPVTEVPMGLNRRGLPTGVQVAACPGNDHVTIAVARELERRGGGWVPPFT